MGVEHFAQLCEELSKTYGPRFEPPGLVRDMARDHQTFYGRFGAKAA